MTTRDNEERLGVKNNQADAPVQTVTENKSLSISVPTEFVDLPSKGRFYPADHPLHGKESVEIRFMTAKEEDILNSRALIKKGVAIDRMLQSVILTPGVQTDDMLTGDKNAVTIAARISGYGSQYGVKVECPSCGTSNKFDFDLEEQEIQPGGACEEVEETEEGTFLYKLPRLGHTMELRLLTGADEKELTKKLEFLKKNRKVDGVTTEQLKLITVSVEGEKGRVAIGNFIENIPALDARDLRAVYKKLVPNVDLTQEFSCTTCDYSTDMEVPITVGFFWPDR